MCFDPRSESVFASGLKVTGRHDIIKAVNDHEISGNHRNASKALLAAKSLKDVGTLIDENLASLNAKEKAKKRDIVKRVVDIVTFIGRQGLAFRGRDEGISDIKDHTTNHGNFLEAAKLLAEYDPILKDHIEESMEIARRRRTAGPGKKQGRGSLVTFMSKSFINKVICAVGESIQEIALSSVKEAGIFSVEIDSTQDISSVDQLAIVVRYVSSNGPKETLLTLTVSHDGTGLGLYNKLKEVLEKLGLDIKNIIACSFDGASNMSGCFKGVQARLKQDNPNLIFTHCAGHCLNLVLTSCAESCTAVKTFFGLVESAAVFMSDSYKRMDTWSKLVQDRNVGNQKLRRLKKWGKTRWYSRPKAIGSIIDTDGTSTQKFVDFLLCMDEIGNSPLFDAKTTFAAVSLRENWCKFENALLAFIMLSIYEFSTPVSNALQSPSIDYLVTFTLAEGLLRKLEELREKFDPLLERTRDYVKLVNEELERQHVDFRVSDSFVVKRSTRNVLTGELAEQENAAANFRVQVFNPILDHAIQGIHERFVPNEGLLKDCAVLDPKRFKTSSRIESDDIEALATIAGLAKVNARQARIELVGFANSYEQLLSSTPKSVESESESQAGQSQGFAGVLDEEDHEASDEDESVGDEPRAKCAACGHCLTCALNLFLELPVLRSAYPTLFALYVFVLSIPTTQVTCERMFSKLKIIKHRLRNLLSQELLEPLLFMSVERELAFCLDKAALIEKIARTSSYLQSILL